MNIILGASGHVGSTVAEQLLKKDEPVKVTLRDEKKVAEWEQKGAKVALADVNDAEALSRAFQGGQRLFMMIPPADVAGDVVQDEFKVLDNYKKALAGSEIKKFVGLSSYGSEFSSGTGNLLTTHRMEHLFNDLPPKKSFVRPAYFFSNWDMALETAKNEGVVHTFFPIDLKLPMVAPDDIGELIAQVMLEPIDTEEIYHIEAPEHYSSADVAEAFSEALGKKVEAVETKPEAWRQAFSAMGFSKESAEAFVDMTQSVVDGKTSSGSRSNLHKGKTTLSAYVEQLVKLSNN